MRRCREERYWPLTGGEKRGAEEEGGNELNNHKRREDTFLPFVTWWTGWQSSAGSFYFCKTGSLANNRRDGPLTNTHISTLCLKDIQHSTEVRQNVKR